MVIKIVLKTFCYRSVSFDFAVLPTVLIHVAACVRGKYISMVLRMYSTGVKNRTSTLLEHCLAKICQTSIMLGT